MNGGLLFAIGTLASWAGWIFLFRTVQLGFQLWARPPGKNLEGVTKGAMLSGIAAALLLLVSIALPMDLGRARPEGWNVPLVWFVMPFPAWFMVISAAFLVGRLVQAWMALNDVERKGRLVAVGAWLAFFALNWALFRYAFGFNWSTFKLDVAPSDNRIEILRGALAISPATGAILLALTVAALAAMALASRATSSRGASKSAILHAALVAGSIVFGLPFAWLVVTSFKEDKDIASTDGLKWTPYVSVTLPYDDPDDPLYEGEFQGRTVQGTVIEKLPDGRLSLDIIKPLVMRGLTFTEQESKLKRVTKDVPKVTGIYNGKTITGMVVKENEDGSRKVKVLAPADLKGTEYVALARNVKDVRQVGLRIQNYTDSIDFLPPETMRGLVYLKNTLILVILSVIGVVISCTMVAYGFSRLRFPGRSTLFMVLLSTMMLPGAVTLLPTFLIFRSLGWIDTLYPLWVPAFFAGAFNVFLLRQFFMTIPMELEDAAKIDGCSYIRTLWQVMVPQIKPALAAISIFTAMGAWNNFMGPLIYLSSPENMPIAYAVQLFQGQRGGEAGLMMAFATMAMMPVLLLFFFAQRYFIEGVTLSGLGGR